MNDEAGYHRLGPLTGNMAATLNRPEMDGEPVTVVAGIRGKYVALPGVCRPQFSLLPSEFRCYLSDPHPEWPNSLYAWDEEGIAWIRDWHAPGSKEVAALLAAYALRARKPA